MSNAAKCGHPNTTYGGTCESLVLEGYDCCYVHLTDEDRSRFMESRRLDWFALPDEMRDDRDDSCRARLPYPAERCHAAVKGGRDRGKYSRCSRPCNSGERYCSAHGGPRYTSSALNTQARRRVNPTIKEVADKYNSGARIFTRAEVTVLLAVLKEAAE